MNLENMIQSNSVSSKELNLCHQFSDKMSTNGSFFIPEIKKSRSCDDLQIGDRIYVNGVKPGTIRFLGETSFSSGIWSGIELDEATGKNDGSVNGIKYFSCQPSYGIFVRPHRLTFEPLGNGENLVPSTVASSVNGDTVNSRCTPTTIHSSLSNRPILSSNGNNINNNTNSKSKSSKSVSSEKWKQSVLRALDSSGLTKGHHNKHHHSDRKKDTRTTLDQRLTSLENEVRQLRSEKTRLADMLVDQITAVKEDNGDLSDQVVSLQIDNIALHMRIDELNKLWTCNKLLIKTLELVIDEWRKDVQSKDLGNQALRDALEKIYLDRLNFCKLRLNRIN